MIFRWDGADSVLTYMLQDLLWLVKGLGSPVHESWTWLNEWIVQRMNWCLVALCNSCSYGWPNALSPSWLLLILLEKRKSFQCQMPNLRGETDCQCVETSVPGTWKPFFFPPLLFLSDCWLFSCLLPLHSFLVLSVKRLWKSGSLSVQTVLAYCHSLCVTSVTLCSV